MSLEFWPQNAFYCWLRHWLFILNSIYVGGNDIQYIQAKSSSRPENKDNRSEVTDSSKKFATYRGQETTEIPIIHGIPGDYVEVSLPPPNSIAEVLEPITRVIYKEKTFRDYKTNPEVKTYLLLMSISLVKWLANLTYDQVVGSKTVSSTYCIGIVSKPCQVDLLVNEPTLRGCYL